MKIRTRKQKGSLTVSIGLGPVMWRCTNGYQNYLNEWYLRFGWSVEDISFDIFLTPALRYLFWRRGILSRVDKLGTVTDSGSFWFDWLRIHLGITLGHTRNTKAMTDDQVMNLR